MLDRLWKRVKRANGTQPPVPGKIAGVVNAFQRRIADQLQERSERLSAGTKKKLLALFMAIFCSISGWITWRALEIQPGTPLMTAQPAMAMPSVPEKNDPTVSKDGKVSVREYLMVAQFHRYLDSLAQSADGRQIRENLLRGRPGLLDSLLLVEKLYLSETKNDPKMPAGGGR